MFSPSDYNDAVPQFSNGNYANEPLNPLYVEEPDDVNYKRGAEPLQTLPVQWWNWLWNKITAKLNNLNIYVKNIFNELAGLLSLVNVTPDATEEEVTTEQLKDMFATKYPQYLNDNFKFESLLHGRTRGVIVAPTDTWKDNTNTLSLTGGFGIINTYHKVTFSDCNLVIPNDTSVHFIVSNTSGVISIQNSIKNNVILIGLCSNKEYCLLIDNNPDQCKDNIILKKWFGQNKISKDFIPVLQSYYDTAIASIETKINIETVSGVVGIDRGTLNNCTINIKTVDKGVVGINSGTLNNCSINIETVDCGTGINYGTYNNCSINIGTVKYRGSGFGINKSTLNNCTINIKTVDREGYGINSGTLNNCSINIETVDGLYGINICTLNNCTISFGTVSGVTGIKSCTLDNCTITIETVSGDYGIDGGTLDNCTINIKTVDSGGYGINYGTFNNCSINIETVNGGYGINICTLNNCTISFGTVSGGYGIHGGTLDNCTITIKTLGVNSINVFGIYNGALNNCTINIGTVDSGGYGIDKGTFDNCSINIETVNGGYGINDCTLNNCTINIKTVNGGIVINNGTLNNCTITIKTVSNGGKCVYMSTLDNCTITIKTVNSNDYGIYSGTLNNCTINIETVISSGTGINNDSAVVLYLTYIKCFGVTSLSNTAGKLNVLNDTVFHAS